MTPSNSIAAVLLAAGFSLATIQAGYFAEPEIGSNQGGSLQWLDEKTSCGAASMAVAARLLGLDVPIEKCREVVASDLNGHASWGSLSDSLQLIGLASTPVELSKATLTKLKDAVLIIHLEPSHWATVHVIDGAPVLFDPPHRAVAFDTRLHKWTGKAIFVARDKVSLHKAHEQLGL